MTRRLCCRERRIAGGVDFTETAMMPRLDGFEALGEVDLDTPRAGASGDQLDHLPAGALEWALERLALNVRTDHDSGNRRPVPRRPWRRVWCWASGGHFWFPDVPACLDCGKGRRRAPWRGDR